MNCEAVKELLWTYLEKETTAEEAEKIEKHLADCADCRAELEVQKEIMDSLQSLPELELPEGYHEELMQKLKVEAAPNVVTFPQKKKKQPVWKQWGMVAAAVLVVVAAGGMNGMLEMREGQNAAMEELKAVDTVEPMAASAEEGMIAYDEAADVTADYLGDMDSSEITYYSSKKMNTPAAGAENVQVKEKAIEAVPEVLSLEENDGMQFSMTRTVETQAGDRAALVAEHLDAAKEAVQEAILAVEGFEEAAETGIIAVIPVEAFEAFVAELEKIGELQWLQKEDPDENAPWRTIEIQLKTK